MSTPETNFFLFLGSAAAESSTSRLKASNLLYVWKRLESGPENWRKILAHLESPKLLGALTQLTSNNINYMIHDHYQPLAERLFRALGETRSVVFIHESIIAPAENYVFRSSKIKNVDPPTERIGGFDPYRHWDPAEHFGPPDRLALEFAKRMLREHDINVMPYKTNAELSLLAWRFIEQADKHLLFRVYIPKGRLWSAEADKLFSLFRDWLGQVKGSRVRQDGYSTPQGQVYEFYGEDGSALKIGDQFSEFSNFLNDCLDHPDDAARSLEFQSLSVAEVSEIVSRYSKEARRLKIDLRHAREVKILSLRHRLESELAETEVPDKEIARISEAIIPSIDNFASALTADPATKWRINSQGDVNVTINKQVVGEINGIAAQHVQGTTNLNPQARELLELIDQYGGKRKPELDSAVHELEDEDASRQNRISARQRLKAFLYGLASQGGAVGVGLLTAYLEGRLGMG
ncbi:hypothetical protein ACFYPX_28485 [Micromonospora zamorensis]|uniref:hypothetical protein n=1 Tax=Micromonospora zamorensis TaxID=709883 RepID=UPI003682EC1C